MKHAPKHSQRQDEHGNALFYVLIAVALLAALSYAISQSSRGNVQQLSTERARLYASEIIEYSNILASAVAQLRLRGVDNDELCFDHPSWPANYNHAGCADNANKIYHPGGAGIGWAEVISDAMDVAATPDYLWHFYGDNEIEEVGSTCGAGTCSDLIAVVDELRQLVCIEINDLLSVTNPSGVPPTDAGLGETLYKGAFTQTNVIGDEAGGTDLKSRISACYQKTGAPAEYVFYRVLIAR